MWCVILFYCQAKGVSITITASNKSAFVLSAEMHVAGNEEKNKRGDN